MTTYEEQELTREEFEEMYPLEEEYDFEDDMEFSMDAFEMGFDPYDGCYTYDC